MDAAERLEELAGLRGYASPKGLIIVRNPDDAPGGELSSLLVANQSDSGEDDGLVRRTIRFGAQSTTARYLKEQPKGSGGTSADGCDLPYDFSESYRIADIWSRSAQGEEQTWEEFDNAKSLVDFLANRLNQEL